MIELNNPGIVESEIAQHDISLEVLKRRCLLKDLDGNIIETADQMYWRVAKTVAEVEANYGTARQVIQLLPEIFYKLMAPGKFRRACPILGDARL